MPRAVRTTVCSGCIQDFPHKEMYLVSRFMNRANPDTSNMYSTMYCAKCKTSDMIDIYCNKCVDCNKNNSSFNYEGLKPKYCSKCCLPSNSIIIFLSSMTKSKGKYVKFLHQLTLYCLFNVG